MTNDLPERIIETGDEDVESIESSIQELYNLFIVPIDAMRSIADPPRDIFDSPSSAKNLKTSPTPIENRTSSFYRSLGLPVVANGSFYSPGFDPNNSNKDKKLTINKSLPDQTKQVFIKRQSMVNSVKEAMQRQDMASSLLGLSEALLVKTFSASAPSRSQIFSDLKKNNSQLADSIDSAVSFLSGTVFKETGNGAFHQLDPYQTDPYFDSTVIPSVNSVCVPFLYDKTSTRISGSPEHYLPRPAIEFIIRRRLSNQGLDKTFSDTLMRLMKSDSSPSTTDSSLDILLALSDEASISSKQLDDVFSGFSSTQVATVKKFIKTIKILVQIYVQAQIDLNEVLSVINFIPVPSTKGLESIGSTLSTVPVTPLEQIILQLNLKKVSAEAEAEIEESLGKFSYPAVKFEKTDDYQAELNSRQQERDHYIELGWNSLSILEIITGEMSGLGLMDILAIYTALWTIPIDKLLGLIDQDAAERLYQFNIPLRSQEVVARRNKTGPTIDACLSELKTMVDRILQYADALISKTYLAPTLIDKGDL